MFDLEFKPLPELRGQRHHSRLLAPTLAIEHLVATVIHVAGFCTYLGDGDGESQRARLWIVVWFQGRWLSKSLLAKMR